MPVVSSCSGFHLTIGFRSGILQHDGASYGLEQMSSVLVVGGVSTRVMPISPGPAGSVQSGRALPSASACPGSSRTGSARGPGCRHLRVGLRAVSGTILMFSECQVGECRYCSDPCQGEQYGQGGPVLSEVGILVQGVLRPCCRLLDRWDAWPLQFRWNPGAGVHCFWGVGRRGPLGGRGRRCGSEC